MVNIVSPRNKSALAKPIIYDDALITSVMRYGEKDCIVRMFTRESGRMSAFFKRGMSGKQGAVFAPALARVGLLGVSNHLARLVSCDIDPVFALSSLSLKKFGYSAYLMELIEKFLPESDPAPEIFTMIEEAFATLVAKEASASLLRSFELKLLDYCGYLPEMPHEEHEHAVMAFDPVACRFLSSATDESVAFSYDALILAKSMLIAKVGAVNYESTQELLMIGRIFKSRFTLMGLTPLKSVAFLKQLSGS